MSVLQRIEQELKEIEASKRSITTALRFTRAELERLEGLAAEHNTTKAEVIRTALRVVYEAIDLHPTAQNNNDIEIDF